MAYARTKRALAGKADTNTRRVEKQGNRVIYAEAFASALGDYSKAKKVLADFPRYQDWLLHQVNESKEGKFKFEMTGLRFEESTSLLHLSFEYHHPVLGKKVDRAWKMSAIDIPGTFCIEGEALADETTMIERSNGMLYMWPAENTPGRLWFHFVGAAQLRSWLIYQFVTESILNRETGERIPIFLNNFLDRHARAPLLPAAEVVPTPAPTPP